MKKYPFKFLDAYGKEDTDIFFGRNEEIEMLYEMVFQTSILLIYGASGTGKTSLIQCGLASKFQSHDWLALTIRRGSNINAAFEKALAEAGGNKSVTEQEDMSWLEEVMDEQETATATRQLTPLTQSLKAIYLHSFRPIYLIFDQFEELFILGTADEQQQLIETVKEILQVEQPVKMIFSIREEYLGHLNKFERVVPQLLRKRLRVEPMNLDKVKQVIIGATSYKNSNVRLKEGETDVIAEGIFDKIKGKENTLTIQLPYLQVFLDKLYLRITGDETRQAEAVFPLEALNKMGDIGDVLRNFLEEQVTSISQKLCTVYLKITVETIWRILSPFATLEGTKEPISKQGLYDSLSDLQPALIDDTVEAFINSRILRYTENVDLYEIAHDSLAKRIAEKRSNEDIILLETKQFIKSQTAAKEEIRELFTEKQLNRIEPYLEKINLTEEEKALIHQSYEAVAKKKAAEKEEQEAEKQRQLILQKQQLLEKNQQLQRRFILWISIALVIMIALAVWAFTQMREAKSQKNANQNLLARNYWTTSQSARAKNNLLEAMHYTAEGFSISKNEDLNQSMLLDVEPFLPQYFLKDVMKHKDTVFSAAFSPDGKKIVTASNDSTARLWDVVTGKQIGADMKHEGAVNSAAFSPDGKEIITASSDNTARLWDAVTGKQIDFDLKHEGAVFSAAFSPDGKKIVTASNDSTARLWDVVTGKQIDFDLKHEGAVFSAAFSPDGKKIVTASNDSTARLWDAVTGKQIGANMKHEGAVNSAAFSPDGKEIITASSDNTARLWDAVTGKQIGADMKHEGAVFSAIFSPDGKEIITASSDNTARLWDAATGKQIGANMKHESAVYSAAFSPDGKEIVTASRDNTARLWKLGADLDIPVDLFKLQFITATGCKLNEEANYIEIIPIEQWYRLKEEYNYKAGAHYKICKYRDYNFWARCNPEEAKAIIVNK